MLRMLRALLDGLLLRCPRCHSGGMFRRAFQIERACPSCGLVFESASGEITGGMGINITVTLLPIMVAAFVLGLNPTIPTEMLLLGLGAVAVGFPIAFYRSSRGLWVAITFLTGDGREAD
jgi:uncharacterized protein (DUF983 family)